MGHSPWGCKELDTIEQLTLLLLPFTLDIVSYASGNCNSKILTDNIGS